MITTKCDQCLKERETGWVWTILHLVDNPPLLGVFHFCDGLCLSEWVKKKFKEYGDE